MGRGERSRRLAERQVLLRVLVHDAPSDAGADPVESGDGPGREGDGVVVVPVRVPVVGGALEPAVELAGRSASTVGDDVVDVAVIGRNVAPGGVLAMTVADLDRGEPHR